MMRGHAWSILCGILWSTSFIAHASNHAEEIIPAPQVVCSRVFAWAQTPIQKLRLPAKAVPLAGREREVWSQIPVADSFSVSHSTSELNFAFRPAPDHQSARVDILWMSENERPLYGYVDRAIFANNGLTEIELSRSLLISIFDQKRIPSFVRVPELTELVDGRGWPTVVFASLYNLKKLGLQFGGAQRAAGEVDNRQVDDEVARILGAHSGGRAGLHQRFDRRGIDWADVFRRTSTYRYVSTVMRFSGHQIVGLVVTPQIRRDRSASAQGVPASPILDFELTLEPLSNMQ